MVQGVWFRVYGSGCMVQGVCFSVYASGCVMYGVGVWCMLNALGDRVWAWGRGLKAEG